jgi:hypothetical protein
MIEWISISILLTTASFTAAQFNESEFIYRVNTIYHSLQSTDLDNVSFWVTSTFFIEQTQNNFKEEIFPLEIIWKNPDRLYYIQRAIPEINDPEDQNRVRQLQRDLQQELKGVFVDWLRFYAGKILQDLPDSYLLTTEQDSVFIQYEKYEQDRYVKVKMIFGLNGLCVKIITHYSDNGETIYVYPGYQLVEDRWLLKNWTVQIYKSGIVKGGFSIKQDTRKIEKYWIPHRIVMQLQKKGIEDKQFMRDYKIRNIVLNKDVKIMK